MSDVAPLGTWANEFKFRVPCFAKASQGRSGSAFRDSDSERPFAIIRADSRLKFPRPTFVSFVYFVVKKGSLSFDSAAPCISWLNPSLCFWIRWSCRRFFNLTLRADADFQQPPVPCPFDVERDRQRGAQRIGEPVEHIAITPRHKTLVPFVGDAESRDDQHRQPSGPLRSTSAIHERAQKPEYGKVRHLVEIGDRRHRHMAAAGVKRDRRRHQARRNPAFD